jgi:hypothetical protein
MGHSVQTEEPDQSDHAVWDVHDHRLLNAEFVGSNSITGMDAVSIVRFCACRRFVITQSTIQDALSKVFKKDCSRLDDPVLKNSKERVNEIRFQVVTATSLEMAVFWDAAPCSAVSLLMEAVKRP